MAMPLRQFAVTRAESRNARSADDENHGIWIRFKVWTQEFEIKIEDT